MNIRIYLNIRHRLYGWVGQVEYEELKITIVKLQLSWLCSLPVAHIHCIVLPFAQLIHTLKMIVWPCSKGGKGPLGHLHFEILHKFCWCNCRWKCKYNPYFDHLIWKYYVLGRITCRMNKILQYMPWKIYSLVFKK